MADGLLSGRFEPSHCMCSGEGAHVVHTERFLVGETCRSSDGREANRIEHDFKDPLLDPAVKEFLKGHSKKWPDKSSYAKYGAHYSRGGSTYNQGVGFNARWLARFGLVGFERANNGAGGGGRRNVPPTAPGYF